MMRIRIRTGITISYELSGPTEAPVLLLIRGLGSSGKRWAPQLPEYTRHFRCLTFDNRGAGCTTVAPGTYTTTSMAEDTVALMDALEIRSAHVSGLSLGGAIALVIALNHPQRVDSLQLHSTWARPSGRLRAYLGLGAYLVQLGGGQLYRRYSSLLMYSASYYEAHRQLIESTTSTSVTGLLGQISAAEGHDVADKLDQIEVPTLVTGSTADMCVPFEDTLQVQSGITKADLHTFPEGSHQFCFEKPDLFNAVTMQWLLTHSA